MINKITIQNFKSIKDKVEIDLKPITLLFGPNSAGKSTVVQAIHYMKEILERNNTDPGKTDLGGEVVDLGGFANLVHRKEGDPVDLYKTNPIVIGLNIQENDLLEPASLKNDLLQNQGYDPYYVEFTIEWDENAQRPIVKKYDVHINGEFIGRIEMAGWNVDDYDKESVTSVMKNKQAMYGTALDMDESLSQPKFKLTQLNLNHPNLDWEKENIDNDDQEPEFKLKEIIEEIPNAITDLDKGDIDLFVYYSHAAFPLINKIELKKPVIESQFKREGGPLDSNYVEIEHLESINDTLTQIFCTPILFLRKVLGDFCYIGPLRTIPERLFNIERTPMGSRWSDGLGAWDKLYRSYKSDKKDEKELIKNVNKCLTELDTGYNISIKEYREIETNDPLSMGLDESGRLFEDGEDVRRSFENFPTLSRMQLIEEKNLIEVTAKDIGSGIAQVLPIIVATVGWEGMLLAVEQPELHVHPAIQQKIADMLIPYTHHNRFILLETHSEHIMLRLLRRIEETTENELEKPEYALKPDKVSVVFVEPTEEGVEITQLPIDETGEFTRNWPRGFFEERAKDLK
jgi:hypothetical protein